MSRTSFGSRACTSLATNEPRLNRTINLPLTAHSDFLRDYYTQAGFEPRGEIEARFPPPVGALRLRRYEKQVY